MARARVDDYAGDDRSYIGYLYEITSGYSQQDCIRELEEKVKLAPQIETPALSRLSNQLEVRARCRNDDQILPPPENSLGATEGRTLPSSGGDVVFELWHPATEYKAAAAHEGATVRRKPAQWEERTATFFRNLPTSEQKWIKKREVIGMSTAEDILKAADALTSNAPSTGRALTHNNALTHDAADEHERQDIRRGECLQDVLCAFAQCAGTAVVAGTFQFTRNVRQFYSQMFIATCDVALHEGHPLGLVNAAQLIFFRSNRENHEAGPEALARHRSTMRWLLQEQQRQFRRGLLHRAFEIFYNEGKDLSFYKDCPKGPKENEIFTNKVPFCDVPDEIQASLPFWIPYFVKLYVGDVWSYTSICNALGVDLLNKDTDYDAFRHTYYSRKLVVCRPHAYFFIQKRKRRKRVSKGRPTQQTGLQTPTIGATKPLPHLASSESMAYSNAEYSPLPTIKCSSTDCSSGSRNGHFRPINLDTILPTKRLKTSNLAFPDRFRVQENGLADSDTGQGLPKTRESSPGNAPTATLGTRYLDGDMSHMSSIRVSETIDPRFDPLRWDHISFTSLESTALGADDAGHQVAQTLLQLREQPRSNDTTTERHPSVLVSSQGTEPPVFEIDDLSPFNLSEFIDFPSDEGP